MMPFKNRKKQQILPGKYKLKPIYETTVRFWKKCTKNIKNFIETKEPFQCNVSYNRLGEGHVFVEEVIDYEPDEIAALNVSRENLPNDYFKHYSLDRFEML